MKICTGCEIEKPIDQFRKGRGYKDGIRSQCKQCEYAALKQWRENNPDRFKAQWDRVNDDRKINGRGYYDPKDRVKYQRRRRNSHLVKKYGITVEEFERLREEQKGLCAICDLPPIPTKIHPDLVVDHCHKTGETRALLCQKCNLALGYVGDDVKVLERMIQYLTPTTDR